MNFSKDCKVVVAKAASGSAGTAVTSDIIDMQGYRSITFFVTMATVNAANFVKVQQDTDVAGGTMADLEGTKVVPTVDGNLAMVEVVDPLERYVRLYVDRGGANTALGEIFAVLSDPITKPVDQASTTNAEFHASPAEGTA